MVKRLVVLTMFTVFAISVLAYPPAKKHPVKRGVFKRMMFFKTIKDSREKLGLSDKQNAKLDKILNEVETYTGNLKKQAKGNSFEENFVKDSFDPFKIEEERKRKKEEIRNFYLSKIKAIHDLLTKEQRQKLVSIIKEKKTKMRKMRLKRIKERRKWKTERRRRMPERY